MRVLVDRPPPPRDPNDDRPPRPPPDNISAHNTHKPTDEKRRLVRNLAGMGVSIVNIARLATLADKTLSKHYAEEIELGRAEANLKVASSLFRAATRDNPNIVAAMFWLKNRANWRDLATDSHSTTINIQGGIDVPRVPQTVDQWLARRRAELAAPDASPEAGASPAEPPTIDH
jgi:hypothetical protein